MLAQYDVAEYNFASGYNYFQMLNFDLHSLHDTIAKVHEDIFLDKEIRNLVTKDVFNWLRDSIFIGSSRTRKGNFILDTTNMLTLEKPFKYYTGTRVKYGQSVHNKIFQKIYNMHTVKIGDKKIYYYLVPANGKLLKEVAEYRIETTGDYSPDYVDNKTIIYNRRHFCDLYQIDWYIRIESDDFFNDRLALKITDSTYYYKWDLGRQNERDKIRNLKLIK